MKNVPIHRFHVWCHTFNLCIEFRYGCVKVAQYSATDVLNRRQGSRMSTACRRQVQVAHLSLIRTEKLKVHFDAIVRHSPETLCRVALFLLFIDIHCHLIT